MTSDSLAHRANHPPMPRTQLLRSPRNVAGLIGTLLCLSWPCSAALNPSSYYLGLQTDLGVPLLAEKTLPFLGLAAGWHPLNSASGNPGFALEAAFKGTWRQDEIRTFTASVVLGSQSRRYHLRLGAGKWLTNEDQSGRILECAAGMKMPLGDSLLVRPELGIAALVGTFIPIFLLDLNLRLELYLP